MGLVIFLDNINIYPQFLLWDLYFFLGIISIYTLNFCFGTCSFLDNINIHSQQMLTGLVFNAMLKLKVIDGYHHS